MEGGGLRFLDCSSLLRMKLQSFVDKSRRESEKGSNDREDIMALRNMMCADGVKVDVGAKPLSEKETKGLEAWILENGDREISGEVISEIPSELPCTVG